MEITIKHRFTAKAIVRREYPDLRAAVFAEVQAGADLSGADLREADIREADLSGADLRRADLSLADLRRADLRRADLSLADLGEANLRGANLRRADLSGADLRRADLRRADLRRADLSGADLSGADLREANLRRADLSGADLSGADLRRAVGLPEAPVVPAIDASILAAVESGGGNLDMGGWHFCETTHCRAGWAIYLAGEAGYELERRLGACAAGALIYAASRPGRRVPDFFASNQEAMKDLRACAAAGTKD